MSRNRSSSRVGHRPARRPAHKSNTTFKGIVPTSLIQVQEIASNASMVLCTFSQPIVIGDPASVGVSDVTMAGTSATTRNGISTTPVDFVSCRVALSGALTQSKTYNLTIAADQGLIQPQNRVWGNRAKTFAT